MAESVVFIIQKRKKKNKLKSVGLECVKKSFPNRNVYWQVVNDEYVLSPKCLSLRNGFRALVASQNPILCINHHGNEDKNCSYPYARIREPQNMAKLIWENAKDSLDPKTSSFGRTLQIYQLSCHGSLYHIKSLALALRDLGLRDFKIWGTLEMLNSRRNIVPYFFVKFLDSNKQVGIDPFWRKTDDGKSYWYADCITVDRKGQLEVTKSKYTQMIREERKNHANAIIARNTRNQQQQRGELQRGLREFQQQQRLRRRRR